MYFLWIIIAFSLFLENEAFLLVLSLLSLTPSKVRLKTPFTTLPFPFSAFLLSFFFKIGYYFFKEEGTRVNFFLV